MQSFISPTTHSSCSVIILLYTMFHKSCQCTPKQQWLFNHHHPICFYWCGPHILWKKRSQRDHTGGKTSWWIPGLWASSYPILTLEELWWGRDPLEVHKAEQGEVVEDSFWATCFTNCLLLLLAPLLHLITHTPRNKTPQNNPNITFSTGTPKALAINILLINDNKTQWKLGWPAIKAP